MVVRADAALRAAVVGTGLIGGSVLLRLCDAGIDVSGWDPDPATRSYARDRGLAAPETLDEAVAGRGLVFCCGPLPTLPETLLRVAAVAPSDCVLTDVGSAKGTLTAFAEQHGLLDRFVPGHPMAGAESAGFTAATPTLLDSAAWVLCPAPGSGTPAFRRLTGLLVELFRARVVPMTPTDHDAAVALASHVPHLLAGALAGAVDRAPLRDVVLTLAAGSFSDGTRVAGTPARRTANMLLGNRERVLAGLAGVTAYLDELADALRVGDADRLTGLYAAAGLARAALGGRAYAEEVRDFPTGGGHADEVAWLRDLGVGGGHVSGCAVGPDTVSYLAHRPSPSGA
ncbi:prephenate dehydrogenase/arogenate dehydrogenase family protein [Micromonospora sp. WMMA1363]|uniref:prephenate dehydrogenase n=1 Tax=Micromonospora sp. WMMA1363 TaxID=3053985 RepID=UPI00259CD781|nr:prephenate dehydrogenase/arogenate dehydrogenase family protein [Micromonospora sp. WMMA1363]MDM4720662.1 prephenate dehydrogenase/arogenate dehydrogenase family protein [Micromonospora sp. WMMA1363]